MHLSILRLVMHFAECLNESNGMQLHGTMRVGPAENLYRFQRIFLGEVQVQMQRVTRFSS